MRILVLANGSAGALAAGGQDPAREIAALFRPHGPDVDVRVVACERLEEEARRGAAAGFDAVVAAGGDGTVNAVAAGLAGTSTALGVLPLGTLNHFAKDLGLPLDVAEAAAVIARGATRAVDVGSVNGRVFVNNSSIGLYPALVRGREERRHHVRNKWIALFWSAVAVFRRFPTVRVLLRIPDAVPRVTPFVFVGNNRYDMKLLGGKSRESLDRGELCLCVANRTGRLGILRLGLRALIGRLEQARDFDAVCLPELWVETSKQTVSVSTDGEVRRMAPPLHYRVLPRALNVLAPA